eukprot:2709455-Amphidinium_carterae.4
MVLKCAISGGIDSLLGVAQSVGRLLAMMTFLLYMNKRALIFVIILPILTALWSLNGASARSRLYSPSYHPKAVACKNYNGEKFSSPVHSTNSW